MKKIFIIFGPPGSGKSTQADILANKFGNIHFNTGAVIEKTIFDPKNKKNPEIQKQKKFFESGKLCQASWTAKIVKKEIEKVHRQKKGIVFSGSPRTIYEAKQIIPLLKKLYGQENIFVFYLDIPDKVSIFRNTHRRICKQCGCILIYNKETEKLTHCPHCGGKLIERVLDDEKTIKIRLKAYKKETKPILEYLKKAKLKVFKIDGKAMPSEVSQNILSKIN